jgi:hypothetical protein
MISRRRCVNGLLTFLLPAVFLLISCTPQPAQPPESHTPSESIPAPSSPPSSTEVQPKIDDPIVPFTATPQSNLDLREANVLDVKIDLLSDGTYRFDVTLLHDDEGEAPSFADSWQVWDLQNNLLGERILTHSHGTQPFTRSATIAIPEDVSIVLVHGHDMEHEHGGQSMEVDLETGEMRVIDEGEGG